MSKSILKNVFFKGLLSIFNIIVPIIVSPYLYRTLGPDKMGRVDFSDSIYVYFMIFASFGVYNYGIREVSRCRNSRDKLQKLFTSLFIIGLVTTLATVIVFVPFVFFKYKNSKVYTVLLIYTFTLLSNLFYVEWANEGLERYNFITKKTILVRMVYVVLLFLFVKSSDDYIMYAALIALSVFFNNIISFISIVKDIGLKFKDIAIKVHIKYLFAGAVLSNANILYTQLDKIMLGSYISSTAVSFYGLGQKIMLIVNALIMTLIQVTIPRLSNLIGNNEEKSYMSLVDLIARNFFAFLFPVAVGIFALSKEIVYVFGGSQYIDAADVLQIFSIYMICCGIDSILSNQILYVKKKEKILTTFLILCGLINLVFNISLLKLNLLTPRNAILTTSASTGILILLEYSYIKKVMKMNVKLFSLDKTKYFLISLLFIPFSMIIRSYFRSTMIVVLLTVAVSSFYYFVILFLTKDSVLNGIIEKIKAKLHFMNHA